MIIKKSSSCKIHQVDGSDNVNPNLCPLCHKNNHCGNVATSDSSQGCWCSDPAIQFPETLLTKVPDSSQGKACICKACALKHK
jgi:hypothetical protein